MYDSAGALQMYGPVISDEEQADGIGSSVRFVAADLSWELSRRFFAKDTTGIGTTYTGQDSGGIAMAILAAANAEYPTGITEGVGGVPITVGSPPVAGTFGNQTVGASTYPIGTTPGTQNAFVFKATLPVAAVVSKLTIYVDGNGGGGGSQEIRGFIYNAGPGPTTLVALTGSAPITNGQAGGWVDLIFETPPTLAAGNYYLGYFAGGTHFTGRVFFVDSMNNLYHKSDSYDVPDAYFGGTAGTPIVIALYATYGSAPVLPSDPGGIFLRRTVTYLWKRSLDAIVELSSIAGSYEWSLRYVDGSPPTVYLDLVGVMGTDRTASIFLEYGTGKRNCKTYGRIRSIDTHATRVWALGSGSTQAVQAYDTGAEARYHARREDVLSFGDITVAGLLDALASQHVAVRKDPRQLVSLAPLTTAAPKYGVDYQLGDRLSARVVVNRRTRVDGAARVWGADITIDELGNETPTLRLVPE